MAIGWPDESQTPQVKPRLGQNAGLHRETYNVDQVGAVASYDHTLRKFYDAQRKTDRGPWSGYTADWLATDSLDGREALGQFLADQGFRMGVQAERSRNTMIIRYSQSEWRNSCSPQQEALECAGDVWP